MSLKRTSNAAGLPDRDDDAPCCWLCLQEGADDSGEPLCRDCSCRGTSGFAHLSCAVKYAESKARELYENGDIPVGPFINCPNCNQYYQGEVEYAFAKAQVEFFEREFKNDLEMNLFGMVCKLRSLVNLYEMKISSDEQYRREGEYVCSKMLSIIEQMKQNSSLERYKKRYIAASNMDLGDFFRRIGSNDYLEKAKKHYILSKDLYEELGEENDKMSVMILERKICRVVAKMRGTEPEVNAAEDVVYWRKVYKHFKSSDEADLTRIDDGIDLALALHNAHHSIESERFLTKLMQICHRVHGQDHRSTGKTLAALERVKTRLINIGNDVCYQALRYENDGESIVVQGPYSLTKRNVEEEKVLTVESKDVIPRRGTPVIVHSVPEESISHLNGKIGDIRAYSEDEDDRTCEIHFEEEELDPAFVKLENLRILFNLPETEETK